MVLQLGQLLLAPPLAWRSLELGLVQPLARLASMRAEVSEHWLAQRLLVLGLELRLEAR